MRTSLVIALLVAAPAAAQVAISGTFSATSLGTSPEGLATTRLTLALQCALTCPASAPALHYRVAMVDGYFANTPSERLGYISSSFQTGVDPSGTSVADTTTFPPGTNFFVKATGASCHCGNRNGEGGSVDLKTETVSIPPHIMRSSSRVVAGRETSVLISANPHGAETLDVTVSGAGIAFSQRFTPDALGGTSSSGGIALAQVTPTRAGTVTVTAVVTPGGTSATQSFEVVSAAGGGSGSSDGGAPPPTDAEDPAPTGGCAAVPGGAMLAVVALWPRRRAR